MPHWARLLGSIWIGVAVASAVYLFIHVIIMGSWTGAFVITSAVVAFIAYKDLGE